MRRKLVLNYCDSETRVLQVLKENPNQSLEKIAYDSAYARCTVDRIIKRLVHQQRIRKISGMGNKPNYYEIVSTSS